MQRLVTKALLTRESNNGRALFTCVQDTALALPKLYIARSQSERSENIFLEGLESFFIYGAVPLGGGPMFNRIFSKLLPKHIDPKLLTRPLQEIPKHATPYILPAKAAIILSALALTGIGGEYVINYAKSILTAEVYKKDKFTDVVNLSQGQIQAGQRSNVVDRAWKRIYMALGASLALVGLSLYGARILPKQLGQAMAKQGKHWLEEPLKTLVGTLDFQFSPKGGYGLTKNQMIFYMLASIPAYLDSARDRLEQMESATRLAIILPYLLWGQDKLEQFPLFKGIFERSSITQCGRHGQFNIKSMEELVHESLQSAAKKQNVPLSTAADLAKLPPQVIQKASEEFKSPLYAKSLHAAIPLVFGLVVTSWGLNRLSQEWTKYRYQKANKPQTPPPTNTVMMVPVPVPVLVFPKVPSVNGVNPFSTQVNSKPSTYNYQPFSAMHNPRSRTMSMRSPMPIHYQQRQPMAQSFAKQPSP